MSRRRYRRSCTCGASRFFGRWLDDYVWEGSWRSTKPIVLNGFPKGGAGVEVLDLVDECFGCHCLLGKTRSGNPYIVLPDETMNLEVEPEDDELTSLNFEWYDE